MDVSYIINQLGEDRDTYFGAVSPPVAATSNFAFRTVEGLRRALADEKNHLIYSRGNNPTTGILCKKLAALDDAEDALVTSSGMAAISTAVLSLVDSGTHVVSVARPYSWTYRLFTELLPRFGVETTFVDGKDPDAFRQACRPATRLFYLESPNTLTYELQDLSAIARIAGEKDIRTVIDNSYCTPLYQQPGRFGIEISVQSATKYIGGHSDAVAGVITGQGVLIEKMFRGPFMTLGTALSPGTAWLLLRGLRTLPLRLERISRTTEAVVGFLASHSRVEKIYYPFHPSFSQHALARRQMSGCGGLFTVTLKADSAVEVADFCERLKRFTMAVSWGGHESLVSPWVAGIDPADFARENETHRQIRFYIGLEDPEVLIADLSRALAPGT